MPTRNDNRGWEGGWVLNPSDYNLPKKRKHSLAVTTALMPFRHVAHLIKAMKQYDKVPIGFSELTYDNYLKLSPEYRALIDKERERFYGPYVNRVATRRSFTYNDMPFDYSEGQHHMFRYINKVRTQARKDAALNKTYGKGVENAGNIVGTAIGGNTNIARPSKNINSSTSVKELFNAARYLNDLMRYYRYGGR